MCLILLFPAENWINLTLNIEYATTNVFSETSLETWICLQKNHLNGGCDLETEALGLNFGWGLYYKGGKRTFKAQWEVRKKENQTWFDKQIGTQNVVNSDHRYFKAMISVVNPTFMLQ